MPPNLPIASEPSAPRHATLILLCAFSVLPLSLFLPSLPSIARDLRADYAFVALSLGGYASLEFVMGPLLDQFGRRPIMLTSLGVFTLGSLGCAMATDICVFLACRLMQAAITSVYPVSMATLRDTAGGARAASRIDCASRAPTRCLTASPPSRTRTSRHHRPHPSRGRPAAARRRRPACL